MSTDQALLYFKIERYSHHFIVRDMSPLGQAAVDKFASMYVQYGLEKVGRFFQKVPVKVFAARCRPEGEARFHIGQWGAWKTFLSDRGIPHSCYTETAFGFAEVAPLNATVKEGWVAHDYQVPIIEYLESPLPETRKLVEIQPGKGKMAPLDALVKVPHGWKKMGDIAVGDTVTAWDGTPSLVDGVFPQGNKQLYKVTFEDGRSTEVGDEHLWRIYRNKEWRIATTLDVMHCLDIDEDKIYIPLCESEECDEVDLEQSPYQLGSSLSDGLAITDGFIPKEYLNTATGQRIALLEGILAKTLTPSQTEYTCVSEQLATDVQYLVRSLGGVSSITTRLCEGVTQYTVSIRCNAESSYGTNSARRLRVLSVEKTREAQAQCISINHPDRLYVTDDFIVTHNTFCAASAIASMGNRMVAFLKPKYLVKWVGDLKAILDIDPEDIEIIKGSGSLMRVISKAVEGTLDCKAILISNKTFQNYIKEYEKKGRAILDEGYDCLPHEFIQLTQCGVKLVDEVHEDFHLNFKIDLYTHVERAISLSATLVNNDPFITSMYEVAYDPSIRYNGLDYDKYVESYALKYRIVNGENIRTNEMGSNSYSHMAFEKSIVKDDKLLKDYLNLINDRMVTQYLTRKSSGQKCLIYAASINMCTMITQYLQSLHKDLDIRRYVENDPYDNLMNADVCISTIGSAGTGHDIKNLITVIMTVAIASKASNIQGFGRLRKLKDTEVYFEYFTCLDIAKHVEYYENKELLISGMAKNMHTETIGVPLG